MRIFGTIWLLLLSLSCDNTQVYTTQSTEDAVVGTSAAVVWRYTVVMDRLLVRDFDAAAITQKKFLNTFTQKTMAVVHTRLSNDIGTALKVGSVITALQGQFSSDSAAAKGLKKIVDAATALALNRDKAKNEQLGKDLNDAVIVFFSDANLRQALAEKGSFISTKLKGPPDIVAEILNQEFINEILAIKETNILQQVVDIPTLFDEMINTIHTVLNDAALMTTMTDPTIVDAASAVLRKFFTLYKELRAEKDNHDVNTIKARVLSMLNSLNSQQLTGATTLSKPLWAAARPVHFKNLKHTDACDSNAWQAVQDLDGESLITNLPETAITALALCRINAKSCDAWGDWDIWTPVTDTVCEGEMLTQTRTRQRTCPDSCDSTDCNTTDTETQDVDGTEVCVAEPVCENSCDTACTAWQIWESQAWWPLTDTVCEGQKIQQRRSRVQRRSCTNLCADKDCPTFQIVAPRKRTVEGTLDCRAQPAPTCTCCDDQNNEITSCPSNSRLAWNSETCSCGTCSRDAVMSCGAVYSSGKLHDDRALDENCACYYKTSRLIWVLAILYGATKGKELLDTTCALQNVTAFKDNSEGRAIRTTLWDDGCITTETFGMGCRTTNATAIRQKFIDFHDRTLTTQTEEGHWGLGCPQVFSDRQTFARRMMRVILTCGDHSHSTTAWEQLGKPPHFDRLYKKINSTFLEKKLPEWGQHLQMCESAYQKNRPDRIEN